MITVAGYETLSTPDTTHTGPHTYALMYLYISRQTPVLHSILALSLTRFPSVLLYSSLVPDKKTNFLFLLRVSSSSQSSSMSSSLFSLALVYSSHSLSASSPSPPSPPPSSSSSYTHTHTDTKLAVFHSRSANTQLTIPSSLLPSLHNVTSHITSSLHHFGNGSP